MRSRRDDDRPGQFGKGWCDTSQGVEKLIRCPRWAAPVLFYLTEDGNNSVRHFLFGVDPEFVRLA